MNVSCADPHEFINTDDVISQVVIIALTPIPFLPQFYKQMKTQSSEGISVLTVVLTIALNTSTFAISLLTKWQQIRTCAWEGLAECTPRLLDMLQILALALSVMLGSVILVGYAPCNTRRPRAIIGATNAATIGLWVTCVVVSVAGPCSAFALGLAGGISVIADGFAVVMYLPQLLETTRQQRSGAFSAATYLLQAAGGYIIFYQQAILWKESWSFWGPLFISTNMQIVIGLVAICFDCRHALRQRRAARDGLLQGHGTHTRTAVASAMTSALLDDAPTSSGITSSSAAAAGALDVRDANR